MSTGAIRAKFIQYKTDIKKLLYEAKEPVAAGSVDRDYRFSDFEAGYMQAVKDMEAENDIYHFIEFIDGIQGRDAGGADVLSWSDMSSATDLKNFLEVYKAHKARS